MCRCSVFGRNDSGLCWFNHNCAEFNCYCSTSSTYCFHKSFTKVWLIFNWLQTYICRISLCFYNKEELHSKIDDILEHGSTYGSNSVVLLADEIPQTSPTNEWEAKIAILYQAMQKVFHTICASDEMGFQVIDCDKVWKYNPVIASYRCGILKDKHIFEAEHSGIAHSCVRFLVPWSDVLYLRKENRKHGANMQHIFIHN